MSDSTGPPSSPPPPPPPEEAGFAEDVSKPPWWKRPVPLWAVLLIGVVALGIGAATADSDEDAEVATASNGELEDQLTQLEDELEERDEEIADLNEQIEATETTETTTTTSTTSTTTTTTTPPSPEELRAEAVDEMARRFEANRDSLAAALSDHDEVETLDRLLFEGETVIIDVTSRWASPDNQHDGAWTLSRELATFWEPDGEGAWWQEAFVPNFRLVNSGRVYDCSGAFMVEMASLRAGRADWEATC